MRDIQTDQSADYSFSKQKFGLGFCPQAEQYSSLETAIINMKIGMCF